MCHGCRVSDCDTRWSNVEQRRVWACLAQAKSATVYKGILDGSGAVILSAMMNDQQFMQMLEVMKQAFQRPEVQEGK